MKRLGRKPSAEKVAARYQALAEIWRNSVRYELKRGCLEAAIRIALGRAERVALSNEAAEGVYMLQFKRELTYAEQDRVQEAFEKVMLDLLTELGMFLPERKETPS